MTTISKYDDRIDSRDVIERIDELRDIAQDGDMGLDDTECEELAALEALAEQCEGYSDWRHGETLIRASDFENYARELAEECDLIPSDAKRPLTCVHWEQAARELAMDYTSVEFDGVEYLIRSC